VTIELGLWGLLEGIVVSGHRREVGSDSEDLMMLICCLPIH
jgi:hypothetical protein